MIEKQNKNPSSSPLENASEPNSLFWKLVNKRKESSIHLNFPIGNHTTG